MRQMRNKRGEDFSLDSGGRSSVTGVLLSVLVLLLVLLFPGHPDFQIATQFLRLPIELPVLIMVLVIVNQRYGRWLHIVLVTILSMLLLLRMADIGSYFAFNRRFSPLLEVHLLEDGWNLASTSIGPVQASIVVVVALLLLLALAFLLYRCLYTIANVTGSTRTRLFIASLAVTVIGTAGLAAEHQFNYKGPVEAKIVPEFNSRIAGIRKSIKDQRQFVTDLKTDSVLDEAQPTFSALAGKDVILVFVESYGRSYIDAERFSKQAAERLLSAESTITNAGLSVRSGWLTSPIRGGRSWLAHSTFQSGLKIDNQARYDRLVTTQRQSLSLLFQQAGWYTVGIMPAIQLAWPEGAWYGYEDLRTNSNLGYAGERFGYVTMPDQYTLHHFDNQIRQQSEKPVMATLTLLSTHAPWTPLPKKVDWNDIGDGSIYDGSHRFGERISWKYRSKVQDMYAESLDYTMDILGEYAARYADDAVIIILGDHQPAPIINGWGESGDVPIHIISRDTAVLERLPAINWNEGMLPLADRVSVPMRSMRKLLSTLFE